MDQAQTAGYVIGRAVDATEHHGDQALQLWDDDVHRNATAAQMHAAQNVDEPGWTIYALREVGPANPDPDTISGAEAHALPVGSVVAWTGGGSPRPDHERRHRVDGWFPAISDTARYRVVSVPSR